MVAKLQKISKFLLFCTIKIQEQRHFPAKSIKKERKSCLFIQNFFVTLHPISKIRVPEHLVKTGVYQITTLKTSECLNTS